MMITNQVTRAVFELIGDHTDEGYSLFTNDKEIPIFLNKDKVTQYPQIRISPFINKGDVRYQKHIDEQKQAYRHWEFGVFQIDIYAKQLILAQNIYDILVKRIFDFFNLETIIYNYSPDTEQIDDNTYRTQAYALLDDDMFKDIYGLTVDNHIMNRVHYIDSLQNDSFFVNNEYLYIKTDKDIKTMRVKMLTQGRLFPNGFCCSDNGIHDYRLSKQRNLSSLEDNEVERISFDLEILFSSKINREELPRINQVIFPKPNIK